MEKREEGMRVNEMEAVVEVEVGRQKLCLCVKRRRRTREEVLKERKSFFFLIVAGQVR